MDKNREKLPLSVRKQHIATYGPIVTYSKLKEYGNIPVFLYNDDVNSCCHNIIIAKLDELMNYGII
jgi:hypothetical protein